MTEPASQPQAPAPEKAPTFEEALAQLEALAQRMESGALGLEDMVAAYERGQKLIQVCTAKLNDVERRIEILVRAPDGQIEARPFEAQ